MTKKIIISEKDNIAAVLEDNKVCEFFVSKGDVLLGDVYLSRVDNVLPSIEAAFVDVGMSDKMGFIHTDDIMGKGSLKDKVKPNQKLIVEVKMMDVLNNLPLYFKVKEILHMGGHKLLIDEVNPSSLKLLNLERLAPDMVKVFWEPLLEYDTDNEMFRKVVNILGADNVVLAKCDTNSAFKWGLSYKINTFQGPIIDNLEVALLQKKCPDAAKCSVAECLRRKRLLWGGFRDACLQKEILEELL